MIFFVDQINFLSLLRLLTLSQRIEQLWYFESISPFSSKALEILQRRKLIRAEVRKVNHHIGQVRDDAGHALRVKLHAEARAICSSIRRARHVNDPLLNTMSTVWAKSRVVLYFDKLTEEEVKKEVFRIGMAKWLLRTNVDSRSTDCVVLIARKKWFSYIEAYARSQGIRLMAYEGLWKLKNGGKGVLRVFQFLRGRGRVILKSIPKPVFRGEVGPRQYRLSNNSKSYHQKNCSVGIRYYHRKLTFNRTERSEFFWVDGSGVSFSEILLYDWFSEKPLDAETLQEIKSRGIRLLGKGPGIPTWVPSALVVTVLLNTVFKLLLKSFLCLSRRKWVSAYYFSALLKLALLYAYWYDFYLSNNIRINVGTNNTDVAQVLALEALDCVSVAYQYSTSNMLFPTANSSAGENVQFVFSRAFERLRKAAGISADVFVYTGLIYDSATKQFCNHERVATARKKLQDNGARFILCFFDENTLNRWDIASSDEDASKDYEFLLRWVLADTKLGLVFKPKKSMTLFKRISRVSGLINRAVQTGRCLFLTSENTYGNVFPAEAASIADICVGQLLGNTAGLEAFVAGIPTVLIDPERLLAHPFYAWGRDRIVFNNWESLRAAVEKYRMAPKAYSDLGDWSSGLKDLDPFQDGQADLRIGLFIRWVYEGIVGDMSGKKALSIAAEKFSQRWGRQYITLYKPN
jgi:hypothetical protein